MNRSLPLALPLLLGVGALLGCGTTVQPDPGTGTGTHGAAASSVTSAAQTSAAPTAATQAPTSTASAQPADPPSRAVASAAEMAAAAKGDAEFAFALYRKVKTDDNTLFSPASARIALAMAYAGAKGTTAEQMAKVLAIPNDSNVHDAFGAISRQWQSWAAEPTTNDPYDVTQPFTLRVANRLFGQQARPFVPAYLTLLQDKYGAPLEQVDFKTAPDPGRKHINQWVEDHTERRIKDLLPVNSITPDTRIVLVNALYFKADWLDKFEKTMTTDGDFETAPGTKAKVPMMTRTHHYGYAETHDAQILEMAYRGAPVAMTIVLPIAPDGLARLEATLSPARLDGWVRALVDTRVKVRLPRFKVESAFELSRALGALGMTDAFDGGKADFSGIDGTKELFIGGVIQKTFCAVDEAGTEAAAATAVVGRAGGAPPTNEPKDFHADHPFLFLIRDTRTGSLLFLGRVAKPG